MIKQSTNTSLPLAWRRLGAAVALGMSLGACAVTPGTQVSNHRLDDDEYIEPLAIGVHGRSLANRVGLREGECGATWSVLVPFDPSAPYETSATIRIDAAPDGEVATLPPMFSVLRRSNATDQTSDPFVPVEDGWVEFLGDGAIKVTLPAGDYRLRAFDPDCETVNGDGFEGGSHHVFATCSGDACPESANECTGGMDTVIGTSSVVERTDETWRLGDDEAHFNDAELQAFYRYLDEVEDALEGLPLPIRFTVSSRLLAETESGIGMEVGDLIEIGLADAPGNERTILMVGGRVHSTFGADGIVTRYCAGLEDEAQGMCEDDGPGCTGDNYGEAACEMVRDEGCEQGYLEREDGCLRDMPVIATADEREFGYYGVELFCAWDDSDCDADASPAAPAGVPEVWDGSDDLYYVAYEAVRRGFESFVRDGSLGCQPDYVEPDFPMEGDPPTDLIFDPYSLINAGFAVYFDEADSGRVYIRAYYGGSCVKDYFLGETEVASTYWMTAERDDVGEIVVTMISYQDDGKAAGYMCGGMSPR